MADFATISDNTVTIAEGETNSTPLDCRSGRTLAGVYLPPGFEGEALTFLGSWDLDDADFYSVSDPNATTDPYTVAVSAPGYVPLNVLAFAGVKAVKIVSDTPVGADRVLHCAHRVV